MSAVRIHSIVQKDGELQLTDLPCRKGDAVEGTLVFVPQTTAEERDAARKRLIERAKASTFYSTGPYPSRDSLYDRS